MPFAIKRDVFVKHHKLRVDVLAIKNLYLYVNLYVIKEGDCLRRLFFYIKKHAFSYCFAIILLVAAVILDMFYPRITKIIIDDVIIGGKSNLIKFVLPAFAGICLARSLMGYLKELMFDFASMKTAAAIRMDLFKHIQSLSFSFFDRMNTGELMSRIKEDVENIWHVLCFGFMLFFENVIYFITASVILFILNWKLAAVSTVTMPVIAFIALKFEKKLHETYGRLSDQRALINTTAQENIAGVRLVKAFGREKYEIKKFLEQNRENCRLHMEQAYIISNYNPKIEFLSNMIMVLVTTIGGILVIGDEISIGTLVAFSSYISMLIWPMRMIGWLMNLFAECKASVEKIEKIFNEKPVIKNPDNPVVPEELKGHVVFKDVCFEYNGVPVLKNISFEAKPGSVIAITEPGFASKLMFFSTGTPLYSKHTSLKTTWPFNSSGTTGLSGFFITGFSLKIFSIFSTEALHSAKRFISHPIILMGHISIEI